MKPSQISSASLLTLMTILTARPVSCDSVPTMHRKCFQPTITCSKLPGCALDAPSLTLGEIDGKLVCAYECSVREDCVSFNFLENARSCLLFNSTPYKIRYVADCTDGTVSSRENVAKFKRSCQSSMAVYGDLNRWPWLALDDLHGTDAIKGDCSQTAQSESFAGWNWYVVDLVNYYAISYVRILAPTTSYGYLTQSAVARSQNITIGITNASWTIETANRGAFSLCGVYLGNLPNATWVSVKCQPPFLPTRFVVVNQSPLNSYYGGPLTMCELQVFSN